MGVRLDSGDLAFLSTQVAQMLDDAGFPDASIVLSNELDELIIREIKSQIAQEAAHYGLDADRIIRRLVYGVGTRLITSKGDSSLGGVYKLVSLQGDPGWQPAIKISEDPGKTAIPGSKRAWRIYDMRGRATADLLTLEDEDPEQSWQIFRRQRGHTKEHDQLALTLRHPRERAKRRTLAAERISHIEPLLLDVLAKGRLVCERPSIEQSRASRRADVARLDNGVRRLINPQPYHVSVSESLWALQEQLLSSLSTRRNDPSS